MVNYFFVLLIIIFLIKHDLFILYVQSSIQISNGAVHLDWHSGHLAEASIQSNLQYKYISQKKEKQ